MGSYAGKAYFMASAGAQNGPFFLWSSDGTEQGTQILTQDLFASEYEGVNGLMYISGANELWTSNGTPAGTSRLKTILYNDPMNYISQLTGAGRTLYFTTFSTEHGRELWKSDGTSAGTIMVKDITPGQVSTSFKEMLSFNGNLYAFSRFKPEGYAYAGAMDRAVGGLKALRKEGLYLIVRLIDGAGAASFIITLAPQLERGLRERRAVVRRWSGSARIKFRGRWFHDNSKG